MVVVGGRLCQCAGRHNGPGRPGPGVTRMRPSTFESPHGQCHFALSLNREGNTRDNKSDLGPKPISTASLAAERPAGSGVMSMEAAGTETNLSTGSHCLSSKKSFLFHRPYCDTAQAGQAGQCSGLARRRAAVTQASESTSGLRSS